MPISRMMLVLAVCLGSAACSSTPRAIGAWQRSDFARASNSEVVSIAAAILKQLFSHEIPPGRIYYLSVADADWRAVVERTGLPGLSSVMFGYRDHMVTDDGIRDRATGLRVYTILLEIDGKIPSAGKVEVIYIHSAGTRIGSSGSKFILEKRGGEWVVVDRQLSWVS